MCGIAGFIDRFVDRTPDPGALGRMLAQIAHRGPDGAGEWRGECRGDDAGAAPYQVALGHRRLAIIDLVTGDQPMENEDGSVVITFNGEIYNFAALRPALERQGHRFKTRSDTETIIHQVEQHGAQLRREGDPAACELGVVERLDADAIAREREAPRLRVPDREREHPPEPIDGIVAPLFVGVNDGFGV